MEYRNAHRRQDEALVRREVELDSWPAASGRRDGTTIADLALAVLSTARIEVEVFGEAVSFKETFLEAGATFEHTAVTDLLIGKDTGKQPAERVVLLHDVWVEIKLARNADDFRFANHPRPFSVQVPGTRKRQRVISRSQSSAGSSFS